MTVLRVSNETRGRELGSRVGLADGVWTRLRGLIGRGPLPPGAGLLLEPCRAVHMHGMTQALDVAFLDREGQVVALYPNLAPGARTAWHKPARRALELPSGTLAATGTAVGDVLSWRPAEGDA